MCEPTTIALGVMAVVSAYQAYESSKSQKEQAKYQEAVANNNAVAEEYARQDAVDRGNQRANAAISAGQDLKSAQEAAFSSRGLSLSSGTPFAILGDTSYLAGIDAATERENASREAYGHQVNQMNFRAESGLQRYRASQQNPGRAAGLSLLSSAAQFGASGGFNSTGGNLNGTTLAQNRATASFDPNLLPATN